MNKEELKSELLKAREEKGKYEKYELNTSRRFNAVGICDGIDIALKLIEKLGDDAK